MPSPKPPATPDAESVKPVRKSVLITGDGSVANTRVELPDGESIPMVRAVHFSHRVGETPSATVEVIATSTEMVATLDRMERELLPPPQPEAYTRLHIAAPVKRLFRRARCEFWLDLVTPLHNTGATIEPLGQGWMDDPGYGEAVHLRFVPGE